MANSEVDIHFNSDSETDFARLGTAQSELIFYARFWRYYRTLHFIACRVLGGPERAKEAIGIAGQKRHLEEGTDLKMSEANQREVSYILGHSEAEILRLQTQAKILRPITERLLRSAGIWPGIRVSDLGSGVGDVAMLAAELVGPFGRIVGIDRNSQVLSIAMERGDRAGFKHLSFHEAAGETFVDDALHANAPA